jgi:hypothetical protein
VIRFQTALGEQLFDVAKRERVAKIPAHGAQNQLWRRLPPLETAGRVAFFTVFSDYEPTPTKVATHPYRSLSTPFG